MKKLPILILIGIALVAFAATDYAFNVKRTQKPVTPQGMPADDPYPDITKSLLEKNPLLFTFTPVKRTRTNQLFERFDMSALNARIYRNDLEAPAKETGDETGEMNMENLPRQLLTLYEVQGPENQGGITYLNTKLRIIDQLDATLSINELGEYGHNSFFFNDMNHPDTGYLFVQVGDNSYGFQYSKKDEALFKTVKAMINALMQGT
ncbi:hypothetical protein JXA05_01680 [Candidatus Peregrinibacteria bacterium]|nr:hypothetical protein [Candidatus Peregrinibacteria bacterium]